MDFFRRRREPVVDPDAHIGLTSREIVSLPQFQIQLTCIVLLHVFFYRRFSRNKDSYFYSKPNIMAHYIPRGRGARSGARFRELRGATRRGRPTARRPVRARAGS